VTRPVVYRVLLLPLAVWTAHVAAGFMLVSLHCNRDAGDGEAFGVDLTRVALLVITLATACLLAACAAAALRMWQRAGTSTADGASGHALVFVLSGLVCGLALLYLAWATVLTDVGGSCP
jgi:hypothetical protein